MSADLDRLLAELNVNPNTYTLVFSVDADTIRRIAADYAELVAERDRWRAIANRLGYALMDDIPPGRRSSETLAALDEWQAAKEEM